MKNNSVKNKIMHEIVGLLVVVFGILTFLSLMSFHPADSYLFTTTPASPIKNLVGIGGALWASVLYLTFGKASYILSLFFILLGWFIITKSDKTKILTVLSGIFILTITLSVLFSINVVKGNKFVLIKNGGIVGLFLSVLLKQYIGIIGLYIVSVSLIFFSLMLSTNFSVNWIIQFFVKIGNAFKTLFLFLKQLFTPKVIEITEEEKIRNKPPIISKVSLDNDAEVEQKEKVEETELKSKDKKIEAPKKKIKLLPARKKERNFNMEGIINKKGKDKKVKADKVKGENYTVPPLDLLTRSKPVDVKQLEEITNKTAIKLEETLKEFGIKAKVINIYVGPVITRFELQPAPGIKISKIVNLSDNIALALAAPRVRIIAPIPGKAAVGVEIPNQHRSMVTLGDLLSEPSMAKSYTPIEFALGKDISGNPVKINLKDAPHLLIAGATGSGKSVCLNSLICSLVYKFSPDVLRFIMVDPKMVELKVYNGIPHLLTDVITKPKESIIILKYLVAEMDKRYTMLDRVGARDIDKYNEKEGKRMKEGLPRLPYIVVIIDEFADLMMVVSKEIEDLIARLAQKARAVGIHLILATQRPSVDVITGIIKANFPTRIAFQVASKIDSRTILDTIGAEKLLGKGDMLLSLGTKPGLTRIQGAFISEEEVEKIIDFIILNNRFEDIEYVDLKQIVNEMIEKEREKGSISEDIDDMYLRAKELVRSTKKASASYLQRRLKIGFNRAARYIDMMEDEGLIGPAVGSKSREVYLDRF